MYIINIFLLVSFSLFASTDPALSQDEKVKNKQNFIEELESDDPEVQRAISQLKKDYNNAKDQIRNKYADKRQQLRIQKEQEMQVLTSSFKNKVEKIRGRYPQKIKKTMKTKPLNKKNMDYLDPRESQYNLKKERKRLHRSERKKGAESNNKIKSREISTSSDSSVDKVNTKPTKKSSK